MSKEEQQLQQIKNAVADYHEALRRRDHGGVAQAKCMANIEQILGMFFDWSKPAEQSETSWQGKTNNTVRFGE